MARASRLTPRMWIQPSKSDNTWRKAPPPPSPPPPNTSQTLHLFWWIIPPWSLNFSGLALISWRVSCYLSSPKPHATFFFYQFRLIADSSGGQCLNQFCYWICQCHSIDRPFSFWLRYQAPLAPDWLLTAKSNEDTRITSTFIYVMAETCMCVLTLLNTQYLQCKEPAGAGITAGLSPCIAHVKVAAVTVMTSIVCVMLVAGAKDTYSLKPGRGSEHL